MSEKNRYSDEELQEFKAIILEKLAKAHLRSQKRIKIPDHGIID